MQLSTSTAIYDYWNSVRGKAALPLRTALRPAPISALLPDLFILEWRHEADITFRLAGTKVCTLLGTELGGKSFASIWDGEDSDAVSKFAREIAENASPACLSIRGLRHDHPPLEFEMVLLPVLDADGRARQIVGSLAPHHVSAWQLLEPIRALELTSAEMIMDPDGHSADVMPVRPPRTGFWRRFAELRRNLQAEHEAAAQPLQADT